MLAVITLTLSLVNSLSCIFRQLVPRVGRAASPPLRGAGGNTEFFMHSRAGATDGVRVTDAISRAVNDAKGEAMS